MMSEWMEGPWFHVTGKTCESCLSLRLDLINMLTGPCVVQGEGEEEVIGRQWLRHAG